MAKLIVGLIIGILVGGVITFLTFVGAPSAARTPGVPIEPPSSNPESGTVEVVLKQDLFNDILKTIFRDMNAPEFPLSSTSMVGDGAALSREGTCDGNIRVLAEGSGVRTGVKFENGRITAPLAFTGSYNSPFGCLQFNGWAKANLELRFDSERQTVFGQVNVETVNLDGVNPLLSGIVTPIVQATINNRVNPIEILRGDQIATDVKLTSTRGRLKAVVSDVRSQVTDDRLTLFIVYSFSGSPST